jgi:hypothetical protein
LLTGKDVNAVWVANRGPSGGKQWEHPYRLNLLRMRCPLGGDDRPVRAFGDGARMGVVHAPPRGLGRAASAGDDKEVC